MAEKCRICLKYQRKLCSLTDTKEGISSYDMLCSLLNTKVVHENGIPDKICGTCCEKLRKAYEFKVTVERSEFILNETACLKRIVFNNINDIKIEIEQTKKPTIFMENNALDFKEVNFITYNDTVIKRLKQMREKKTQMTAKEFLNSVKFEPLSDCDSDQDLGIDPDYEYNDEISPKAKKRIKKKEKEPSKIKNQSESMLSKPIKPVVLHDIRVEHYIVTRKTNTVKTKQKYISKTGVCPYCAKILCTTSINGHIQMHTGTKSHKCDYCPKTFFTRASLINHIKVHTEGRNYKCDQCIASFRNRSGLNSHMKAHSDEKKHVCNVCKKGFKLNCHLVRHLLIHNFGKKPVECELCNMTFNTKPALKHHMRVHTGERPFNCEICSQPYSYKHDFNRHCLKKHGVFLKRRPVYVMNQEVLERERALMKDLTLHVHGIIKDDYIKKTFEGRQGPMAFAQAVKAIENSQIPVNF